MATASANTIRLNGPNGQMEEFVAASGSAIKPGMLVRKTTATAGNVHATSGGIGAVLIAHEDALQGYGTDDVYAVGAVVNCEYVLPGAKRHVLLKANENVALGDFLISGGDGTFIKTTGTPSQTFAIVEEASNVATTNLIAARFI
jgi:hypothetical protein